ncbi:Zn-ribbon domain-containing OB-fold protein [Nocardia sp. NPDC051750]|uniref:Zn-ribbon domain-containing OB-fold protein n=1 Tax=Nocardia sp. NPDC051750 TaxID=3364325 RepID=UPI0037BD8E94
MEQGHTDHIREAGDDYLKFAANALMIRRCVACSRLFAPPVGRCSSCWSDTCEEVAAAGTGSIVCWRIVQCAAHPRAVPVATTIAIVELDEGPWVYTAIDGDVPASGHEPVRVRFCAPPCGDRFPIFEVLTSGSALAG